MFVRRKSYLEMFDNLTKFAISQLGIPLSGEIRMLSPGSGNAHNYFRDKIYESNFHTSLAAAYAAMVADRNDVLLVLPGLYTETATLDWTKDRTHLVGLGGSNILGRMNRPNTMIYTNTEGVDYVIHLTGDFCQFHNIMLGNGTGTSAEAGAGTNLTAANLSAMFLGGYGNIFKRVAFRGLGSALQGASVLCSSLEIGDKGSESEFTECIIGVNAYGVTRTTHNQGQLLFSANPSTPPSPSNLFFKKCLFLSRSETAGVVMVQFATVIGTDRILQFERCHFDNFSANYAVAMTQVFGKTEQAHQTTNINLVDCTHRGYTYWADPADTTNGSMFQSNMPASGTNGGKMITASST